MHLNFARVASGFCSKNNQALAYRIMVRMASQRANLLKDMDEKFIELLGYIWGRSKK